jgi:hypothetical protein
MQVALAERDQKIEQLTSEHKDTIDCLVTDHNLHIQRVFSDQAVQVDTLQKALAERDSQIANLSTEHSNQVDKLSKEIQQMGAQLVSLKNVQPTPIAPIQVVRQSPMTTYKNGDILHGLEHLELTDKIKAVARRMEESGQKVNKSRISELVSCSRTTVQSTLG